MALVHVGLVDGTEAETSRETRRWLHILAVTRSSWRRAYNGEPATRMDRCAVALAEAVDDEHGARSTMSLVA